MFYDPTITDDDKPAVVRKKEITWKARVNDYKLFAKGKLEAHALILHAVDVTWSLSSGQRQVFRRQLLSGRRTPVL